MLRRLAVVLCCCVPVAAGARGELHRLGFTYTDLAKVAPEHRVQSVGVAAGAPSFRDMPRVDLSDEVPPVKTQGSQGSCAAWSIAYYHRSQLEYRERHWDLADPNHQFSPAFTYNQVNGGADYGSSIDNNMSLICEQGCASMFDFPYDQLNCTRWPSESAYSHAIPFRTREWEWLQLYDTFQLNMVKQLLCNGSTSCLGILVWGNFDNIGRYNNIYCVADKTGEMRGGHLVTFVGYDDTMHTHDGVGAFKLVNSWGPGWGARGFFWMSYQAVLDWDMSYQEAGYLVDTVGYVPRLLARVRIQHPTRDRVGLEFSVGPKNNALWYTQFRNWRWPQVDHPFPDSKIVFDLTEGAPFIANRQTDSVYFWAYQDYPGGHAGTILRASAQHLAWGTDFASIATPVPIPTYGTRAFAGMRLRELDRDVTASWIFAPSGIVEPESSYVPRVEVRNNGRTAATFPVSLAISTGYADSGRVDGLAPGRAETLAFTAWTAPAQCSALVRCSTALTGDEYEANDACTTLAWTPYFDATVTEIAVPRDTVGLGAMVCPKVRVRNNGTQPAVFIATFSIPADGYRRSSRTAVAAHAEASVLFATWIPRTRGSLVMRCTLELTGDMDPANDTISGVVTVGGGAGVTDAGASPAEFRLEAPRPGLFRGSVELRFGLPRANAASLAIYDATGARVRRLMHGRAEPGAYRVTWDGRDDKGHLVSAGAYFCRLESGRLHATVRLLKL